MTARLSSVAEVPPEAILTQQYGVEDWIIGHPGWPRTYDFVSNRAWVANSQIPMVLRLFARVCGVLSAWRSWAVGRLPTLRSSS